MNASVHLLWIVFMVCISCSNEKEEVHYYKFKDIQYHIEKGDGLETYDTPMGITSVTRNSTQEGGVYSPEIDPYVKNHERYVFTCDAPADFNPTEGYVHVPIPLSLSEGDMTMSKELKEYSMEETDDARSVEKLAMFPVPPMTKLTISGELTIEKLTLTYTAVFVCCLSGEERIVKGKYIRYRPCELRINKKFEELD